MQSEKRPRKLASRSICPSLQQKLSQLRHDNLSFSSRRQCTSAKEKLETHQHQSSLVLLAGNLMVILVILRHHRMRTITNFFLANLAVADFFVGVFCVLPNLMINLKPNWVLGNVSIFRRFSVDLVRSETEDLALSCETCDLFGRNVTTFISGARHLC